MTKIITCCVLLIFCKIAAPSPPAAQFREEIQPQFINSNINYAQAQKQRYGNPNTNIPAIISRERNEYATETKPQRQNYDRFVISNAATDSTRAHTLRQIREQDAVNEKITNQIRLQNSQKIQPRHTSINTKLVPSILEPSSQQSSFKNDAKNILISPPILPEQLPVIKAQNKPWTKNAAPNKLISPHDNEKQREIPAIENVAHLSQPYSQSSQGVYPATKQYQYDSPVARQILQANPKLKDLLSSTKNKKRYMVIHPDGTVEHVDDMTLIKQKYPDHMLFNANTLRTQASEPNSDQNYQNPIPPKSNPLVTPNSEPYITQAVGLPKTQESNIVASEHSVLPPKSTFVSTIPAISKTSVTSATFNNPAARIVSTKPVSSEIPLKLTNYTKSIVPLDSDASITIFEGPALTKHPESTADLISKKYLNITDKQNISAAPVVITRDDFVKPATQTIPSVLTSVSPHVLVTPKTHETSLPDTHQTTNKLSSSTTSAQSTSVKSVSSTSASVNPSPKESFNDEESNDFPKSDNQSKLPISNLSNKSNFTESSTTANSISSTSNQPPSKTVKKIPLEDESDSSQNDKLSSSESVVDESPVTDSNIINSSEVCTNTSEVSNESKSSSNSTSSQNVDVSNEAKSTKPIVWFRTTDVDQDFWDKLLGDEPHSLIYFYNVPASQIVEKETKTTIFPNGTIIEKIITTKRSDDDDGEPVVTTVVKVTEPEGAETNTTDT